MVAYCLRSLSCVSFLILSISGFSQNAKEIYDEILATRNPNLVLEILNDFDISSAEPDSLKSYLWYYKGTANGQLGNLDTAIAYVQKAEQALPEGHPIIEIQILRGYGNIYWAKSFFNLSLSSYQKALSIAEELNNGEFMVSILGNIAGVYAKLNDLPRAMEYALRAEEVSKETGISRPRSHLKIGTYSIELGHYEEAIASLRETIKRIQVNNRDSIALGVCYLNIGKAFYELSKFQETEEYLTLAETTLKKVGYNEPGLPNLKTKLAIAQGDLIQAEQFSNTSINSSKKSRDLTDLLKAYEVRKDLYLKKREYSTAVEIQELILALNDSIKSVEAINKVYELETQFNLAKKESEIRQLRLEGKLKDTNLAKSRNAQFAIGIIAVLLVALITLYFSSRNKKLKAEQKEQELQLEALQKRFLELHSSPADLAVKLEITELNEKLNTPLTEREFDALRLSLEGKTNTEISDFLFISVSTVKFHLRNTYSKMGVGNRKEAFRYMLKTS